jgi:ParB-like chromosome segregation protein Spo0J
MTKEENSNPQLLPCFTLLELNTIVKALRASALAAKPFSKEGIADVHLAEKIIKNMKSVINNLPEEVQEELKEKDIVVWKEFEN